jgi:uncharacterized protein
MLSRPNNVSALRSLTNHPVSRRAALAGMAALAATTAGIGYARVQDSFMLEERWSAGGLHGNFARPHSGPERGPAVLLLQGSGGIARNGGKEELRMLAQGLAVAGIRSLRYDKRSVGESRHLVKRPEDYTLPHLVDDAAMAARDFAARPDVSEVIIAGHSEGSMLATMAAPKAKPAAIALLAGPGRFSMGGPRRLDQLGSTSLTAARTSAFRLRRPPGADRRPLALRDSTPSRR